MGSEVSSHPPSEKFDDTYQVFENYYILHTLVISFIQIWPKKESELRRH